MSEIICPNCKKAFKVDNAGYSEIVKQVRDKEFTKQIQQRLDQEKEIAALTAIKPIEEEKQTLLKEVQKLKSEINETVAEKDLEISKEKVNLHKKIQDLESKLKYEAENKSTAQRLAVSEALKLEQEEKNNLKNTIEKLKNDLNAEKAANTSKISEIETKKELDIIKAIESLKNEKKDLENELSNKKLEQEHLRISLESKYSQELESKNAIIKYKDDEIARIQEMKQKLSTKMLGESLEQHCEIEFNKLRATAFQNAEFNKDNDISSGTKGDFIYREFDEFGNEIISIMFEMKNENEQTQNKKKNEDFFAKLDKDRKSKKCEYAILVSLLETDSELYNSGIVDVSYKFEKMYVIRPQFFIPIITLLRNSAMKSLQYKQEMEVMRSQNIDITNFESKITDFRDKFSKNYESASNNFEKAIDEIDKSIKRMEEVKKYLTTTANQLRLANDKAQGLTIKKLTYNNQTMKEMFENLDKDK